MAKSTLYSYDVVVETTLIRAAVDHIVSNAEKKESSRVQVPSFVQELDQWRRSENGIETVGSIEMNSSGKKMLSFDKLLKIHNYLQSHPLRGHKTVHLTDLLHGSCIVFPSYKQPARSEELDARLDKIRASIQAKDYQNMVGNVGQLGKAQAKQELTLELQATHKQLWVVANFLLTVVGSFVFGFYAAFFAGMSTTACVLLGFTMALVVFIADIYFIANS